MKQIKLTKGKSTQVDDEDFEGLSKHRWLVTPEGYARTTSHTVEGGAGKQVLMHRVIMNVANGVEIDHVDSNPLNNQKNNLRVCTRAENCRNQKLSKVNTSGYKGVSWHKANKKWSAQIMLNQKLIHLGYFESRSCAAMMYNRAAVQLHGKYAKLNHII